MVVNGDDAAIVDTLLANEEFRDLVENLSMSREALIRSLSDRKEINDECRLPTSGELTGEFYQDAYERDPFAARANDIFALEAWQDSPRLREDEDPDVTTPFEESFNELGGQLSGGAANWFEGSGENHALWPIIRDFECASGVGHWGACFIAFDDPAAKDLSKPVAPGTAKGVKYIRVFTEAQAGVAQWENDPASERFGWPLYYSLSFVDTRLYTGTSAVTLASQRVHWTRVVHGTDTGTPQHRPRLKQIINNILGLQKVVWGCPEMYWKAGWPGLAVESDPKVSGGRFNLNKIKDRVEQYMRSLQKVLVLNGFTVKTLPPNLADPTAYMESQIKPMCVKLATPQRIFMGSERGELASSTDLKQWEMRKKEHRNNVSTPRYAAPVINRCIWAGALEKPTNKIRAQWPASDYMLETEKAQLLTARTGAVATFIGGGGNQLIPEEMFLVKELGYTEEEAKQALDNVEEKVATEDRVDESVVGNAFCATGAGGGVDPTCSPGKGMGKGFGKGFGKVGHGDGHGEGHAPGAYFGHHGHAAEEVAHMLHIPTAPGATLTAVGSVVAGLKLVGGKLGAQAAHLEHMAKEYISENVIAAVAKLPEPFQTGTNYAFAAGRVGLSVAFASYTAGQAAAERIALERGSTPEEARRLRGVLATADVALAKPTALLAGPKASFVPLATASYLAYSTARNPLAVMRVAKKGVFSAIRKLGLKRTEKHYSQPQSYKPSIEEITRNEDTYELLAAAIIEHEYDDLYIAMLSAAMDSLDSAIDAVAAADEAYADVQEEA